LGKKLGIAIGPAPLNLTPYTDHALPPPPKLSLSLIVSTVAILLLVVFLLVNTNQGNEQTAPWPSAKQTPPTKNPPAPLDNPTPPIVANNGPRDAEDTAELVALLQQGVKHIRLVGDEYDLAAQNLEGQFQGDDLRLDGGTRQPNVRLAHSSTAIGSIRTKTLTFRGNNTGTLTLRGIRFVGGGGDMDADAAAIAISGFERVTIEQCSFRTAQRPTQSGPTLLHLHSGQTQLKQCYFAPGAIGVTLAGGAKVHASECAFGPQHALFRVTRLADETSENEIKLDHCSALLLSGAIVELEDRVPCQITAGHCLFGGPTLFAKIPFMVAPEPPVIVRQRGTPATTTRYEASKSSIEGSTQPNIYYHVAAYAEGDDSTPLSFAACAKERPFINDDESALKVSPWEARDPLALLDSKTTEPRKAFVQNLRVAQLRIPGNRQRALFGTMSWLGEQMHPLPLPAPDSEPRDTTVKIWDPALNAADELPPGVYPTLKMALAAVRKGDTLLIRHTGRLEIDPCEFDKADTNLTIKPEGNSRPLLVPVATTLKKTTAMFKLYGGRLVLDGLHFRLPADRTPALVAIPGSGQLECRNAIISFDDADELNAVVLADPKNEMMMAPVAERGTPPKINFENVVLRGKGRLLSVRGSRAFELDVKNSLAVLDGTLIEIDPANGDPASNGMALVRLNRCTTYLSGNLLHLKAGDKKGEMGPTGLAKTDVNATNCLFVPATDNRDAFVRADRFDTREQVEKWFAWSGKNNLYGYDKKKVMLEIRVTDVEAMPMKMINGDRWLELASEEGDPFASVRFDYVPPEAGRAKAFLAVRPNDFRIKSFDPPRLDTEPDLGAPSELPRPFAEE
jgi:hypothetical protein